MGFIPRPLYAPRSFMVAGKIFARKGLEYPIGKKAANFNKAEILIPYENLCAIYNESR